MLDKGVNLMLRDSPYIFGLMFLLMAMLGIGTVWYISDINEDSSVAQLNEVLRGTAISQVDLVARVDPGHVYINQEGPATLNQSEPDFESEMLFRIQDELGPGSQVRFDYATNLDNVNTPATLYEYSDEGGARKWVRQTMSGTRTLDPMESIEGIRVRIRSANHTANVTDMNDEDYWTYQSTVEVNRSDKIVTVMDELNEPE